MEKHCHIFANLNDFLLMTGQQNRVVQKDNSGCGNGITWACEVGAQTMVCPLIVEDLGTPRQMLIEV